MKTSILFKTAGVALFLMIANLRLEAQTFTNIYSFSAAEM